MIERIRIPLACFLAYFVAGCIMAPGDPIDTNSPTSAKSLGDKPGFAAIGSTAINPEATPWETGYDPYSYRDIRPGTRPALNSDEAGLWLVLDRAERKIRLAGNRVRDVELNTYIADIVCTLAGPYCPDFRTYVMRIPQFNASMMGNGTMQVWTGLLLRSRNEAQLVDRF